MGEGSKSWSRRKDSGESEAVSHSRLLDSADEEDVHVWCHSASESSLQREDVVAASLGFVGSSFRSEDSEALALWEEKSEMSPKAVSSDLGWLKANSSPWRGPVSSAVRKIESLSHAFSRGSPVHPKGDAAVECPGSSLEYLKKGGPRSSLRDFKINVSSPVKSTETVLHNSPKARYSNAALCRVMDKNECELQFGSSAAARSVDFNLRRPVDGKAGDRSPWRDSSHVKRVQRNGNEFGFSCGQSPIQPERLANRASGKPESDPEAGMRREMAPRATSSNSQKLERTGNVRQTIAAAAERSSELLRQAAKIGVEAAPSSMERCSSAIRSHSMDEAMLNEYASEAGHLQQARAGTLPSHEGAAERKPSHRYYQRVTSRERSSRWSSCDDSPLDYIDFVAPSAARFLEDEGCVSPVKSPIKSPGAVPFKWEKEPGKPKEDSDPTTSAQFRSARLQLPPRLSSPLRNRHVNMSMSAPLSGLYNLPRQKLSASESESTKVQRSRIETAVENSCFATNSERGLGKGAGIEALTAKSRSVGDVRSALHSLSRLSAGGDHQGVATQVSQCADNARELDRERKPARLNSGNERPTSPTSILCGPCDGSHPSSNPSLSSEPEAPEISARGAALAMSHSRLPSCASFDSMEHSIDHVSEVISPESSLTSPLRANTRCNSMSYNYDFDYHMSKCLSADFQKRAASRRENAFVKFCKTGKRWMKTKTHSKLGTIYSPEVWTPGLTDQFQRGANSDFSARLAGGTKVDHGRIRFESRFAPSASALLHEDIGDRSPAYAATLDLLSPVERFSSKKTPKNCRTKPPPRFTRKTTSRLRVRARMRACFLVPMRRILRTLFSRCTFRRGKKSMKVAVASKRLYHVDYTLSQADF